MESFLKRLNPIKFRLSFSRHFFSKVFKLSMALGSVLFFFLFLIGPFISIIKRAFIGEKGFTLDYIKLLIGNQQFFDYVVNSFKIGVVTTFFTTCIALPLAFVNSKFRYRGKGWATSLIILSTFTPPFVSGVGIKYFFSHYGTLNRLFMSFGLIQDPIPFLGGHSMFPIVFMQVLHLYPIMYLNLSSTLLNIDPSIDEASITLGVGRVRRYRDIIWPLARPGFFSGGILVFIWSFTDLGTPLMTNFNSVLSVGIFHEMSDIGNNPYAYAMVLAMMCITTVCVWLLRWFLTVDDRHKMLGKTYGKRVLVYPRGGQVFLIYGFLVILISLSLLPHVGVVITSLADRWCNSYFPTSYSVNAYKYLVSTSCLVGIKNSLFYGFTATWVNLFIGSYIAYTLARKKGIFVNLIDSIVMMPLFLPGVVLAFGYLLTYINTGLDPGKNPVILLVMAYSMRYIPYTIRACTASFQQLGSSLEEAANVFGVSGWRSFRDIILPSIMFSMVTSGILAFCKTITEVSESLFLATKEAYYPVTKLIYSLYCSHGDGPARASALGFVVFMMIGLLVMSTQKLMGKKANGLLKMN